jgi:pimeloyl-ACP methyl ester carboxylesterase
MFKNHPKTKKVLKIICLVVLGLAVILTGAFLWWRQQENIRLQSGSQIMDTANGPVEYATFGEGPAVLVLHGTIGGYDQAQTLAEMLDTEAYQFISVSRPGYLRTPLATGLTFAEQADAYAALLDELGIDQVAVMAISGGGPPALQFALRHPDRTWGLVMIAANSDVEVGRENETSTPADTPPPPWLIDLIFSDVTSWLITSVARWQPQWVLPVLVGEDYSEAVLNDPVKLHLYTGLVNSFSLTSQRRTGSFNDNEQFLQHTGQPFEDITAPMLILQGTEDSQDLRLQQQYLDEIVPDSTYIAIDGGTHFMPASHNEMLAPIILDFLAQHTPATEIR